MGLLPSLCGVAFKLMIITSPEILIPCLSPEILNLFNPGAHPISSVQAAKTAHNNSLATYISIIRDIVDGGHRGQKPMTHVEDPANPDQMNNASRSTTSPPPPRFNWSDPMKGPVYA